MQDKNALFRNIPQVDKLLQESAFQDLANDWGSSRLAAALQEALDELRADIAADQVTQPAETQSPAILTRVRAKYQEDQERLVRPLLNCTGISLHTNLGRAPLSASVMAKVSAVAESYSNLEYRLEEGRRGSRYDSLEALLCDLCGTEAALVVNNNAAAVMLILREIAKGQEAIVSRGELVEIGGKFRVPDVMEESGAKLVEVGTTNKTRLSDYAQAFTEETACILKVHRSNFRLEGFQEEADLSELSDLAHAQGSLLIYDLGSGLLHPDPPPVLRQEPTVAQAVQAGCDLICFSGDKLLGGPQAGIIIGRKALVDRIKTNPLTRALRCDKLTLTALQETLKLYPDVDRINREIPLYRMLTISDQDLANRAMKLQDLLVAGGLSSVICQPQAEIGGGSVPGVYLSSVGLALEAEHLSCSLAALEAELRRGLPPVIAYIQNDQLIFDLRTLEDADIEILGQAILAAYDRAKSCGKNRKNKDR